MLSLDDCRRFYAEEIQFAANLTSPPLIAALARVPREKFLGPGPWEIGAPDLITGSVKYVATPDNDPRHVYHNVVIALDRSRDLFNGQPGTLALYINALDLAPGDRVYHLGTGTGYYTAIIAEVVGSGGAVVAAEVHPELGPMAQKNLADRKNVAVHAVDGAQLDPGECDAMLINAGVTHPLPLWLDRLRPGGRLLLPITMAMSPTLGKGVMLKITRKPGGYGVLFVSFVAIYSAIGARDAQREALLAKAFASGAPIKVKSVRRDRHEHEETCIVHGDDVCLSLVAVTD